MKFIVIVVSFTLVSLTVALPVDQESVEETSELRITSNQLFQQLNDILKRQIDKELTKEPEIGDKIQDDDKSLQISVQQFSFGNNFPVRFRPKDEEVLEDKTVIAIVDDFDGSSEFIIKKDNKEEEDSSKDETTNEPTDSSTTLKVPTTLRSNSDTNQPSSTSTQASSDSETTTTASQPRTRNPNAKTYDPVFYSHK